MANIILSWQNRTDAGIVSGGSWLTALPLANVQNRQVQKVARSNGVTLASTQFNIDLQSAYTIGVIAFVVHNISVVGKVRVTGSDTLAAWTNALTSPADFTNAAWAKTNITVNTVNVTSPDNAASSVPRLNVTANGAASLSQTITASGTAASIALYVRQGSGPAEANRFRIRNTTTATDLVAGTVNYATGAVTYITGTAGISMVDAGGGWWRLTLEATTGITVGNSIAFFLGYDGATEVAGEWFAVSDVIATNTYGMLYQSNWVSPWPSGMIPADLLEWEDDNFWLGTLSQQARAGYQSPFIHLLPTARTLRYWRFEVSDTANSDGYVQIGRLFMGSTWVPTVNYAYNAALGYQDPTPIETSLSGAEYFDVRSKFRVFEFELQYILSSEAYSYALELQRLSGSSGEVLCVPDKDDETNQPRRAFVGRLLSIDSVRQPQPTAFTVNFKLKELL